MSVECGRRVCVAAPPKLRQLSRRIFAHSGWVRSGDMDVGVQTFCVDAWMCRVWGYGLMESAPNLECPLTLAAYPCICPPTPSYTLFPVAANCAPPSSLGYTLFPAASPTETNLPSWKQGSCQHLPHLCGRDPRLYSHSQCGLPPVESTPPSQAHSGAAGPRQGGVRGRMGARWEVREL